MKYYLLFLFLSIFFWPEYSSSQNVDINKIIQKEGFNFVKNRNINSVSIGIYKDGKIYTQHFGRIEKGKGDPPTDSSVYEIGSVTKPIVGFVVAKAVLEGKINLDDDVTKYLEGDFSNLQFNSKTITIQHLLTHTSGLPTFLPLDIKNVFSNLDETVPDKYFKLQMSYSKEKFFNDLKNIKLSTEPGTTYSYSNAGAELMGYILEVVYDKSLDELLNDSFLMDNKMNSTAIALNDIQTKNVVEGYWMDSDNFSPLQINRLWGSAGHVKMNIQDMMKFAALQLDNDNPVVKESQKVLYQEGQTFKLAYFWRVWQDKYGTSYNHHGGTTGTQNWLFLFPKYDLGITVITNQSGPKTPKLINKTIKRMLKDIVKD